jgi:ferrous iron transport protein A
MTSEHHSGVQECSLDKWPLQVPGEVLSVIGSDAVACRLLEMGILEGEPVRILGYAPLGDPMEIRLRDFQLSLRLSEAKRVIVRQLQPTGG